MTKAKKTEPVEQTTPADVQTGQTIVPESQSGESGETTSEDGKQPHSDENHESSGTQQTVTGSVDVVATNAGSGEIKPEEITVMDLPIVLVVTKNEKLAELAADSVKSNFEQDVRAIVVSHDPDKGLVEKLTDLIAEYENDLIVVFDSLIAVKECYMFDVCTIFAERTNNGWNYNTKTPYALDRSKIVELLERFPSIKDSDFVQKYFEEFHGDELPIVTDWRVDTFTLPVVSATPSHKTLTDLLQFKRWLHVSEASTDAILYYFGKK